MKLDTSRNGSRRTTIADVGKRAGVSIGTVSRVLNNAPNVEPNLRERVLEAVRELNYQPDIAARSMRMGRTMTIGVVIPDVQNPLSYAAVSGLEEALAERGYTIFLANSRYDEKKEALILQEFVQRRVDGIIATLARDTDSSAIRRIVEMGVPLVLLERESSVEVDAVHTNQIEGTYRATRYLLGMGHERIGLLTVPTTVLSGRHRLLGFEKAFADLGKTADAGLVRVDGYGDRYAIDAAYSILSASPPPTALVVSGALLAGALTAVRQLHLTIPDDVSLVNLGDTELAALTSPPITSISYDWSQSGKTAARLMLARIEGRATAPCEWVVLPYEFILRQSCRGPSSSG